MYLNSSDLSSGKYLEENGKKNWKSMNATKDRKMHSGKLLLIMRLVFLNFHTTFVQSR